MSYIGNKKIEQVFIGEDEVTKIFVENNLVYQKQVAPTVEYFVTFSSPNSFTLSVNNNTKSWDGTLETSTDKTNWTTWGGTSAVSSASDGTNHNIYVRGTGNTLITGNSASSSTCPWRLNGTNISIKGNAENLLDYATVELGNHPAMAVGAMKVLFAYPTGTPNGNITDISEFILGAETLINTCYRGMFQANTGIITFNSTLLPATTLASSCYQGMFYNCTGLTTAPTLPATTLADYCYDSMFQGCTSLTTVPELPVLTLAERCYEYMFYGCTNLTTAPELPATTLASWCYAQMFSGCTNLTTAPELPATTLAIGCYGAMFRGCMNLVTLPELPAISLPNNCYEQMFYDCSKIQIWTYDEAPHSTPYRIPTTGTGTVGTNSLYRMFTGTGGNVFDPNINQTYYTSNTVIGGYEYLTFSSVDTFTLKVYDETKHWDGDLYYSTDAFSWTEWDGTEINSSNTLINGTYNLYLYGLGNTKITGGIETSYRWVLSSNTISGISCIGNIETLLDTSTVKNGGHPVMSNSCFTGLFLLNAKLISAPDLLAVSLANANQCYRDMFRDCTRLVNAPQLPATVLSNNCYQGMFSGCTSLATVPVLPAQTLETNCYQAMFSGCLALTSTPALLATTLAESCYNSMFMNCTNLNSIPLLSATTLYYNCYYRMFYGCSSLKISETQTGEYNIPYRIPTSGNGTFIANWASGALNDMFSGTGGNVATPTINQTYYTSNTVI